MTDRTRRTVIGAGAAVAAGSVVGAGVAGATGRNGPAGSTTARDHHRPGDAVTVDRSDPRYGSLVGRGYNRRFSGTPERIHLPRTTADVVDAVNAAVRAGRRIAVRGGGHTFEDFVDHPDVDVVIDLAAMTEVAFDHGRRAFAVEAGAPLGEVYRRLYLGWGVTIPAGTNPGVGVGGHVVGAGYGALCRLHGLTVDHLYAVEVVVVDSHGRARAVVATRNPSDPHRDLWWAHTGGGGGNFGIVTRYWFRSPGARGTDPAGLLPRPPSSVLSFTLDWDWPEGEDERDTFTGLVDNYGRWAEQNSAPGASAAPLYGEFVLSSRPATTIGMTGQVSTDRNPGRILDDLVAAVGRGIATPRITRQTTHWLRAATQGLTNEPGPIYRVKIKSGYPRRRFTERQVGALYKHLTRPDYRHPGGLLSVNTYGGRVNAVDPSATAMPHRDSIFILAYLAGWIEPAEDSKHLGWMRELYRDVYAETGGVPADDGTFINYPDIDLADPEVNRSGTPWHRLYYGDSYGRLQQVKRRWDPRDVFRHALSIRPR